MAMIEQRRKGIITQYHPSLFVGEIRDVQDNTRLRFHCRHIRSFALREKLFFTNRFGELDIVLKPDLSVTYCICENGTQKQAGRIEIDDPAQLRRDLTAPSTAYIQSFSYSRSSKEKMAGWINPHVGSFDETDSLWFDITNVVDPALKAFLQLNIQESKPFWVRRELCVSYWCANIAGNPPSAIHIRLNDDYTRRRLLQQTSAVVNGAAPAASILTAASKAPVMPYEELPLPMPPITAEEQQMLLRFRSEAHRVTSRDPAIQNRLDAYWALLGRGQRERVLKQFEDENNLKGTKLAKLCEAACCYLDQQYAAALMCCVNAGSYDFGAELALHLGEYAIAQRMAEKNLSQEYQSERTKLLTGAAEHTKNASGLCALFAEYLEDEDFYGEICDELCEEGQLLLQLRGVADAFELEGDEVCSELERLYNAPIPQLNELLHDMLNRESGETTPSDAQTSSPAPAAEKVVPKSPEELKAEFLYAFKTDSGYRVPDASIDGKYIPMLDAFLSCAPVNVTEHRIPLLIRVLLAPESAAPAIERYLKHVAEEQAKKRKQPDRDRRYRFFNALLAFAKASDDSARTAALAKADKEKNGPDETAMLAVLMR